MGCVVDSTLSVAAASFDFTGLPTTYAHLRVIAYLRGDTAANAITVNVRLNNDSGANYSWETILTGATEAQAQTSAQIAAGIPGNTAPANSFGTVVLDIPFYGGATNHKSFASQDASRQATGAGGVTSYKSGGVGFAAAAAISRVTILPSSGNFVAGSRCSIYAMGS